MTENKHQANTETLNDAYISLTHLSSTEKPPRSPDFMKRHSFLDRSQTVNNVYICYLPAGRSVLEKYLVEVSKTARDEKAEGRF